MNYFYINLIKNNKMNESKFPYLILDHNKSQSDEDSDFSENEYKNKNFKIQKYEKFKPKPIINKEKNTKTLLREENKVKDLLSNFLKNMVSEGFTFKQVNTLKIKDKDKDKEKDKDTISIKKRIKKIKTATNKNELNRNNTYGSFKTNKDRFIDRINDKYNEKYQVYKNTENNKFIADDSIPSPTPKSSLFSNNVTFHPRKVGFNLNPTNNKTSVNTNTETRKEGILKKRTKKKNSLQICDTLKNKQKRDSDKILRKYSYTEKINLQPLTIEAVRGTINKAVSNKRRRSAQVINNIRTKIKKTKSQVGNDGFINFKNEGFVLIKNIDKRKKKMSLKNFICNFVNNNNSQIKKKKNVFNDSNHNSLFSESSDCINRISIDPKKVNNKLNESNKKENNSIVSSNYQKNSTIIKKELSLILSKKKTIELTDSINKNSIFKFSMKPKKAIDLKHTTIDTKPFKRSETTIKKNNNMKNKSKYQRLNTHFNSLKEQIKQSIILRPDEINLSSEKEDIISNNNSFTKKRINEKKRHNSLTKKRISINLGKTKKSNRSHKNILNLNLISNINLGILSKQEIKSKNYSNKNIKKIRTLKDMNQINEYTTSKNKLKVEEETHEDTKLDKKESSKSASFEDFSMNSIKRKNVIHYEKYRIVTHKGLLYDSLDDEEFEDEEDYNQFYIDPHSFFSKTFDSILFISAILSLIEVPLYLAMNHNFCRKEHISLIDGLNFFIEFLNIIDLFLGFFRAYYNWEEQLIRKNKIIALKYFTGWFLFDLIASVPVYSINKMYEPICNAKELSANYYNVVLDNAHYLFICNRLFKIIKVFLNNQAWKILSNLLSDNFSMIVNISLVLAAINYTACLYIFIARNSYPNWIMHIGLELHSFNEIYICSIYILIMALTTVGYGDITCYSLGERIFQLLLLVVGIMAYSWLVSSFSNYIKKINERSADYESRKSILDEIKINNPNLPDHLYDRILRYLKFKNFHERKLKNIIFDCLPVGLKNNLISEMYKPIIKNFIFFKNFQNTDFIVRVILCFKPVIAYKNDILVNEGDMVEDIMFVKRGVLSVELPINMTNPQENIDKYLNMPLLKIEKGPNVQKIGNTTIIPGNDPGLKNILSSINDKEKSKNKKGNYLNRSSSFGSSTTSLGKKKKAERRRSIKTTYVKILGIRENEHFGDVLMFLEQRSPLRVRVRSKKSELFFLKKMDAVKISTSYQNIWKRINKKSVFNFEQIKKSIRKIVEIYCSVRKIGSSNDEDNSGFSGRAFGTKESLIGVHPQNYDLNNSALISKNNLVFLKKKHSLNNDKIKNLKIFFKEINDEYFSINNNNINNNKKQCYSSRPLKNNYNINSPKNNKCISSFSSSSSSSSSIKKSKINKNNKKLIDMLHGNYKFYRGVSKNYNEDINEKQATIISEEPDKESSLTYLNYTNSLQKISKKKSLLNTISMKKSLYDEIKNPINEIENEDEKKANLQKRSSFLMDLNKMNKDNLIDNTEDNISKKSSYNKDVNIEIYPGEEIAVNKEDTLLCKKIDFNSKNKILNKPNNILECKNSKIEKLLNSFDNDKYEYKINYNIIENKGKDDVNSSETDKNNEEKYKSISDCNSNNYYTNRHNELHLRAGSSKNYLSSINNNKTVWDLKILSINDTISFQIDSSYENYNLISGDRLIKNHALQNKLKNYLLDEISKFSRFNTNSNLLMKTNSLAEPIKFVGNQNMFQSTIKPSKKSSASNIQGNHIQLVRKKTKKINSKSNSSLSKRARTINSNSQAFERNSSFYDNNINKNRRNKDKFQTGIGPAILGNTIINNFGKKKTNYKGLFIKNTNNNINNYNIINAFNTSTKELQRRITRQRRNSIIISSFPKNKKKKDDLLSQINFNIQKTNQNLNNPDEFYSNYFSFLLEGEIEKNNQKNNDKGFQTTSTLDVPKLRRGNRNRSIIIKK